MIRYITAEGYRLLGLSLRLFKGVADALKAVVRNPIIETISLMKDVGSVSGLQIQAFKPSIDKPTEEGWEEWETSY